MTTKAQKRVEIAKDVLAQIKAKRFKAEEGNYLSSKNKKFNEQFTEGATGVDYGFPYGKPHPNGTHNVKPPAKCNVCAIGAVFISALDKHNDLKINDLSFSIYRGIYADPCVSISSQSMIKYLEKWFSNNQLRLMELAFEGEDVDDLYSKYNHKTGDMDMSAAGQRALDFRDKVIANKRLVGKNDAEKLLRAIMRNIIKNNGQFKP